MDLFRITIDVVDIAGLQNASQAAQQMLEELLDVDGISNRDSFYILDANVQRAEFKVPG